MTYLIFPHQLFEITGDLPSGTRVILYEDPLFFTQYKFHKQKLLLHRASMKAYEHWLHEKDLETTYLDVITNPSLKEVFELLSTEGVKELNLYQVNDYLLNRRLARFGKQFEIELKFTDSPMFLLSKQQMENEFLEKKGHRMAEFYKKQRHRLDILMDHDSPVGGKWSFDEDNRKSLPKKLSIPTLNPAPKNRWVEEASDYIEENFEANPGETESFLYPINFTDSRKWFQDFLANRLANFGTYEDAIHRDEGFLFHAVLTPMLNIGLLTPKLVLNELEKFAESNDVPLNAHEGFVRQVIGWREYMRGVYHAEGVFQRTNNHFQHKRKIPQSFYTGNTGIPPIDQTIKRLLKTGYNHHIERLMILGNFMLLCEFDPDEIYRWFMELYIDSYDWVMVPNVYGMTQYSDGGRITTKPYISGSNYVLKMSNYSKGEWCKVWNALYWYFIFKRREEFLKNPRMGMMIRILDKMNPDTLEDHVQIAEEYLASLD